MITSEGADWKRMQTTAEISEQLSQSTMEGLSMESARSGMNATDGPLPGPRDVAGKVIPAIILVLIVILSVFGNLAVIIAILKTPRLRDKTSNIFLINLSLTDLLNASLVMPSAVVSLIADGWLLGTHWCYAQCAFNYWFIIVSMLTLALISIDGYYAVIHPMHYINIITPKVTKIAICYAWLQGCVFALIPVAYQWVVYDYWEVVCAIDWDNYSQNGALTYVIVAFVVCFLVPATVMTFCYTKICRVARQKACAPEIGDGGVNGRRNRQLINDKRVIQSLALVVAVFFLCMTPFCVTKLIKIFRSTSSLPSYLYLISAWFGYLASATNPFIYAICRRDFRRAFKHLFCRGRIFPNSPQAMPTGTRASATDSPRRRRTSQSVNTINRVTGVGAITAENRPEGNQTADMASSSRTN